MAERIGNTRVFRNALISKVDRAAIVERDVFEKCIALDGAVNIRLCMHIEIDDFCIAAALKVKDAVIIPAMLIVTDEKALRIG